MKKRRFSKQDWIEHGLSELSANGCEAVKLEAICASAELTRGSFYHHFEDHQAFLLALASHWLNTQTTEIASTVKHIASADVQNRNLTEAALDIDYRLELGIRELGRRLPEVGAIVRHADTKRLEVLSALYERRHDVDADTAANLAYLEYAAFNGIILLEPDISRERQMALADFYDQIISAALCKELTT